VPSRRPYRTSEDCCKFGTSPDERRIAVTEVMVRLHEATVEQRYGRQVTQPRNPPTWPGGANTSHNEYYIGGWADHLEFRVNTDGVRTMLAHPYDLGLSRLTDRLAVCVRHGLSCEVDAASPYYPGATTMIAVHKPDGGAPAHAGNGALRIADLLAGIADETRAGYVKLAQELRGVVSEHPLTWLLVVALVRQAAARVNNDEGPCRRQPEEKLTDDCPPAHPRRILARRAGRDPGPA
jgi:hypothetical protein